MKRAGAVLFLLVVSFGASFPAHAEKFLSVSDIHFNPFYDPALMAKLEAADASEWGAIFATSTVTTFSPYGSDINDPLFRSAVGEMQKQIPAPAFVLISGDFLAHSFNKSYQQYATDKSQAAYTAFVAKTNTYVASVLRAAWPTVRIYPTLGNNDSDCGDYAIAPNGAFLKDFRDVWKPIVGSRSFDRRFPTGGYYHADLPGLKNVRVISLNTVFFSSNYTNPCGTANGPDAGMRELAWLDAELELARLEHKRVWLLYHIPPGMDVFDTEKYGGACPTPKTGTFWKDPYTQKYLGITARHKKTIAGSFAGHTHQDEFRIVTGDFIHISPSVTPIFGNNPAFEIVDVHPNGDIAGYVAWHLPNLTLPWAREYSYDDAYRKPRYDTATLTEIAGAIEKDEATRTKYFGFMSSGNPKSTSEALAGWKGYWCGLTIMNADAFTRCYCSLPK
jgi:hypothetical protein